MKTHIPVIRMAGRVLTVFLAIFSLLGTMLIPTAQASPQTVGDSSWSPYFQQGTGNAVFAIAATATDIYVGGDFLSAGGIPANHVARYNLATHQWFALGAGVNNRVYAIAAQGSKVYVGGGFTQAGGINAAGLAVWDTSSLTWSQVGGVPLTHGTIFPQVRALAFDASSNLFVGGYFEQVGTLAALNVAKWSGTSWTALGSGVGTNADAVYALAVSGSDVYAGGSFNTGIDHWNGASWSALGDGTFFSTYKSVNAIAISGSLVYAAGDFTSVYDTTNGTLAANHIAQWNSSSNTWAAMSNGTNNGTDASVYTLAIGNGNLYAGGQFSLAGGVNTKHIAMWNGTWNQVKASSDLFDGTNNNVNALAVNGNDLFAGGYFLTAGEWQDNYIVRWDMVGQQWHSLANGTDGAVTALAISGNQVYAGGGFQNAGGSVINAIAQLNIPTNTWSPLGTGLSGCNGGLLCLFPTVYSILVVGQDVYVGGNFIQAGGVSVNNIARWSNIDHQWHALGGGVGCSTLLCSASVYALSYDGSCVIVGGSFTTVNGTAILANNLAQWCSNSWSNLTYNDGTGTYNVETNGPVHAITWDNYYGLLYVGGAFASPVANLFSLDYRGGIFPVGDAVTGQVNSIVVSGNSEFIGGNFTNLSGNPASSYIAEQSGASPHWLPLGNGLNDYVTSLALQGNSVIAAGNFTTSGAIGLSHVARWDGASWNAYGSGTDNLVNTVVADDNFIFVGGTFQNAGGKPSASIGRWGSFRTLLPLLKK